MVPTASSCLFAFICTSPVKSSAEPTPTKINKQLHGFWPGFTMVFGFTRGSWVHDGFWDSQCSIDAPGFTMGSAIHNRFAICNIVAISYSISDCISITVSVHCISVWYYQSPFQGHFRIVPFSGISSHIKPAESSNWIGDWGGGGGFLRIWDFSLFLFQVLSLSLFLSLLLASWWLNCFLAVAHCKVTWHGWDHWWPLCTSLFAGSWKHTLCEPS